MSTFQIRMENNEKKKQNAQAWFRNLRDHFCAAFKEIDTGLLIEKHGSTKGRGWGDKHYEG